jgi:hypothetical protein
MKPIIMIIIDGNDNGQRPKNVPDATVHQAM